MFEHTVAENRPLQEQEPRVLDQLKGQARRRVLGSPKLQSELNTQAVIEVQAKEGAPKFQTELGTGAVSRFRLGRARPSCSQSLTRKPIEAQAKKGAQSQLGTQTAVKAQAEEGSPKLQSTPDMQAVIKVQAEEVRLSDSRRLVRRPPSWPWPRKGLAQVQSMLVAQATIVPQVEADRL